MCVVMTKFIVSVNQCVLIVLAIAPPSRLPSHGRDSKSAVFRKIPQNYIFFSVYLNIFSKYSWIFQRIYKKNLSRFYRLEIVSVADSLQHRCIATHPKCYIFGAPMRPGKIWHERLYLMLRSFWQISFWSEYYVALLSHKFGGLEYMDRHTAIHSLYWTCTEPMYWLEGKRVPKYSKIGQLWDLWSANVTR